MYALLSRQTQAMSDLAARLTDLGLEMLAGMDTPGDSVATELRLWHVLRAELERESRRRSSLLNADTNALPEGALRHLVRRATRRIANEMHSFAGLQAWRTERAAAGLCHV